MKKYMYYFLVIGFFMAAGICYFLFIHENESNEVVLSSLTEGDSPVKSDEAAQEVTEAKEEITKLLVHICGEVKKPGVYEFFEGARIMEGIAAAGGFTEDAAEGYLNLAQKMTDEQRIYVPGVSELLKQPEGISLLEEAVEPDDGRININTASVSDLMKLPGIGEKKAGSIIAYREANGYFREITDLLKVDGISTSTYEKLKDLIAATH